MAGKYYLANGKDNVASTVVLDTPNGRKREFQDIASIDLITMEIPFQNARAVIAQQNPNVDLSGTFYSILYPYKKVEMKTMIPMFDYSNDNTKYYLDGLKEFASQREFQIQNKKKIRIESNDFFEQYLNKLVYKIFSEKTDYLTDQDSIIANNFKDFIKDRKKEPYMSTDDYINSHMRYLHGILGSYTALRNIVFTYLVNKQGLNANRRLNLIDKKTWSVDHLDDVVAGEYEQLDFFDLIEKPKTRKRTK